MKQRFQKEYLYKFLKDHSSNVWEKISGQSGAH